MGAFSGMRPFLYRRPLTVRLFGDLFYVKSNGKLVPLSLGVPAGKRSWGLE